MFTCEHGGNRVPREFARLFRRARDVLESHRGYDPGSLPLAKSLATRFEAPIFFSTVTRLLVELNRSPGHRRLFSEFTGSLDKSARRKILERYYHPYRRQVESWLEDAVAGGAKVLHVSVHTFTPELDGRLRTADVGLLYDPARRWEARFARAWQTALAERRSDLRVRRNYPYLGKSDGFTTHLRRRFPPDRYAGIELEVNQLWPAGKARDWRSLQTAIADSLALAIASAPESTRARSMHDRREHF